MRTVTFPHGPAVPALGQGTWYMGEDPRLRASEIASLRRGLDLGLTLIDTATMYGDGAAEELVGEALDGRRDDAFVVTKVLPWDADAAGLPASVHASLRRLRTDRADLVLLHWRGGVPLEETATAFEELVAVGDIGAWGVSNLDVEDLAEAPRGYVTDQVLYNLTRRGPELDLLPFLAERGIPVMAYSPVEQARLLTSPALAEIAAGLGTAPATLALAWTLRSGNVIAIPKTGTVEHVEANAAAASLTLDDATLAALDAAFPAPTRKVPLQML